MGYLLIISRVIFGGYFIMSGINHLKHKKMLAGYAASKKVPSPKLAVVVSGVMVILGGLGIMLALYVPASVALIVLFMVPVTFMMHNFWTESDPSVHASEKGNFMKNMALLAGALAYLFV
ncbi:MAG: DoxX family protein [Candidatus Paceibacterota bacterium]